MRKRCPVHLLAPLSPTLFQPEPSADTPLARVALERGLDQPEGLTYAVPPDLADLQVGDRVSAPLGRHDRPVEGYVVEVITDPAAIARTIDSLGAPIKMLIGRAKGPRKRPAQPASFPPGLLRLAEWMSHYYCCPLGMVLSAMVPAAVKRSVGSRVRTVLVRVTPPNVQTIEALPRSAREAWEAVAALADDQFPAEPLALRDRLSLKSVAPINRMVRAGLLEERTEGAVRAPRSARDGFDFDETAREPPPPTLEQQRAIDAVSGALGSFAPFLLYGVTGSGKTEVYLRVLDRVLARGQCGIVLVPEIALTPQTVGRFLARFADRQGTVAVLHSGLTAAQRNREWTRVASGEAKIVVGARSAVFAPFPKAGPSSLGIIIVDEEHDSSYKQDQLPRYHARDVALRRAQLEGCAVVLGSATPSLESWHNALPESEGGSGKFALLPLRQRVAGGALPRVKIVDLAEETRHEPGELRTLDSVGATLRAALDRTLARDGQAILLLNRRGYASYICCPDQRCGWFMTCTHCDVTVVYHKRVANIAHGVVRCHHCLSEQTLPRICPQCGQKRVNTFGFGTQRLEEELVRRFPPLAEEGAMLRLDSDTMRSAADYFSALSRFRDGKVRLLLGTQMIAKGLDFPGVELIGVINADTAINLPDFRSAERTFQLVSQVAGRAGRSARTRESSRVIVQTFNPHEPAIRFAAEHDFAGFAERELALRREAALPPIGRMARIVCRDPDGVKATERARRIALELGQLGEPGLHLKGPMPCPISRIAGQHRVAVEILAPSAGPIQRALAALRSLGLVKSDAHTAVDVDPIALL